MRGDANSVSPDWEMYAAMDNELRRVCGDLHSHVTLGHAIPSKADREAWEQASRELQQPHVGLLIAPGEYWDAGYPCKDWVNPEWSAWLAEPGKSLRKIDVAFESRDEARLRELWARKRLAAGLDPHG